MKKTRKQKVESEKRREKFLFRATGSFSEREKENSGRRDLYSLENLNLKKETVKTPQVESPREANETQKESKSYIFAHDDYSYLRRDLTRILVFCAFALGIQIVLHLTLL